MLSVGQKYMRIIFFEFYVSAFVIYGIYDLQWAGVEKVHSLVLHMVNGCLACLAISLLLFAFLLIFLRPLFLLEQDSIL